MSNDNTILDNLDKVSTDAMVIANHDVNQQHGNVVWKNMINQAESLLKSSGLGHPENLAHFYNEHMRDFEEEILTIRYAAGEDVQKKDGSWKYSRASQNSSYRSNKSVISNAIENSVSLTETDYESGEDIPVPKSKLEKDTKAARTTITTPTAFERATGYVTKLKNVAGELSDVERHDISESLKTLITEL